MSLQTKDTRAVRLARLLDLPLYQEYFDETWFDHNVHAWHRRHTMLVPDLKDCLKQDEAHFFAIHDLQTLGKNPFTRGLLASMSARYSDVRE
jgi:hypothetical protein